MRLTVIPHSHPLDLVTFTVGEGEDRRDFLVHKEFACRYSPVLRAAFDSNFIEGQMQAYTLEDTDEETFRLLVQWFYTQRLDSLPSDDQFDPKSAEFEDKVDAQQTRLTGLWVLADKLLLPKLQNLALYAIDRTRIKTARSPTHCFDRIWEGTATDSPLRRYMVDICARRLAVGWLAKVP